MTTPGFGVLPIFGLKDQTLPMKLATTCHRCPRSTHRKNIVWGEGSPDPGTAIFIIGQDPGKEEDRTGRPFVGKSGELITQLLAQNGLNRMRSEIYITNLVKCIGHGEGEPTSEEIAKCDLWLQMELDKLQPEYIVTVGRFSTRHFLGDVDMSDVHGLPYHIEVGSSHHTAMAARKVARAAGYILESAEPALPSCIVIPVYHPASALHNSSLMLDVTEDFRALGEIVKSIRSREHIRDDFAGREDYGEICDANPY